MEFFDNNTNLTEKEVMNPVAEVIKSIPSDITQSSFLIKYSLPFLREFIKRFKAFPYESASNFLFVLIVSWVRLIRITSYPGQMSVVLYRSNNC